MDTDTKPENDKQCSKCGENKKKDKFIKNRNICKDCRNIKSKEHYNLIEIDPNSSQECNTCFQIKPLTEIVKDRIICKVCNNLKRRNKYHTDEEHRLKLIQRASVFKHNKVVERQQLKLEEIGEDNKKCSVCFKIKNQRKFRYNRLKCRDCERDDSTSKFKRVVRCRIWYALKKHKSHFNLENIEEQMIAFNWRNTMPLSAKENLSKNNKILIPQIEQHLEKLKEYHLENKLDLPQVFIDLFAKHLVAGNPLEPSLPL